LDAGIKHAKGLLALLGSDPENVFLVLTAREMNPTLRIIARANDPNVENKLYKAGADRVISPFKTAGTQIANEMLLATGQQGDTCSLADGPPTPQWIVVGPDNGFVGNSVGEAADLLGGPIMGMRRGDRDWLMPAADEILNAGDSILAITSSSMPSPSPVAHAGNSDIVIIDDNPVITKLYTRLFQKAGFVPHTAADGTTGLALIEHIRPSAAVIDYMLPVFSGIEICTQIRKNEQLDRTRLILFTADDNTETRTRAMDAGADAVVVKSPDAHEVVNTVLHIISKGPK
jgi:voltage-gated potassium channel